jgi:DNA-binding transcriptional LysR family regulator
VAVETYNYELQMSLVARGRGLGLVPARLLARSSSRRNLCTLNVRGMEFPMKVWMVTGTLPLGLKEPIATLSRALGEQLLQRRAAR